MVKNKEATEHFKEIIKKVRNDRKQPDGMYYSTQQLPFTFDTMLEYLSLMERRNDAIT